MGFITNAQGQPLSIDCFMFFYEFDLCRSFYTLSFIRLNTNTKRVLLRIPENSSGRNWVVSEYSKKPEMNQGASGVENLKRAS